MVSHSTISRGNVCIEQQQQRKCPEKLLKLFGYCSVSLANIFSTPPVVAALTNSHFQPLGGAFAVKVLFVFVVCCLIAHTCQLSSSSYSGLQERQTEYSLAHFSVFVQVPKCVSNKMQQYREIERQKTCEKEISKQGGKERVRQAENELYDE